MKNVFHIYLILKFQDICLEKLKNIEIDKTNTGVNDIDVKLNY